MRQGVKHTTGRCRPQPLDQVSACTFFVAIIHKRIATKFCTFFVPFFGPTPTRPAPTPPVRPFTFSVVWAQCIVWIKMALIQSITYRSVMLTGAPDSISCTFIVVSVGHGRYIFFHDSRSCNCDLQSPIVALIVQSHMTKTGKAPYTFVGQNAAEATRIPSML